MKSIVSLLAFFFSSLSFAGHAIVIGYRTPIYEKPDVNSKKVQILKEGEKIYIHDRHLLSLENQNQPGFYQTLDTNANIAFVKKNLVKLLTYDLREEDKPVNLDPDPTDYRIKGHIPDSYPFIKKREYRGSFSFGVSPGEKNSYNYNQAVSKTSNSNRVGLNYTLGQSALEDLDKRLFFGAHSELWLSKNTVHFQDASQSEETMVEFHLGPQITYEFFRNKDMSLSLMGAMTVNFTHAQMSLKNSADQALQKRTYNGIGFSPKLQTIYTINDVLEEFSFRLGLQGQWTLPHSLKTSAVNNDYGYWNSENDELQISNNGIWSVFIGFQKEY